MIWMRDRPSRVHLRSSVLAILRPDSTINRDHSVRQVRPSALANWSAQLDRTWPCPQMRFETLLIFNGERYKEPLALPLDGRRLRLLRLLHNRRLKRFVRLRYRVSRLNLRNKEMDVIPSAQVSTVHLGRP